jgi:serine/threonine protein kinase
MPAASPATDRNLLLGILALQMDFISRDALIAAMHAWVLDKAKPLGQILVEQGALRPENRAWLEAGVEQHLARHGNDAGKSLSALRSLGPVREDLRQIADADVQASLTNAAADDATNDPYATREAVGVPTSSGQRFRILRPHARGGLGEVFVARDEELNREVALKEIQGKHADHPEGRARFLLEAEVTGGLEHPGVVPVYGLGRYPDGRPYYAMRFIRGDSLKEAVAAFHHEKQSLPPGERALRLRQLLGRFVDVCNAVAYAHSRGVLHRDLKPANVMLGPYGETLVVDWGLAKILDRTEAGSSEKVLRPSLGSDTTVTQTGAVLGTPAYMSPEQAAGKLDELGPTSDVYSLGATLFCLLTGQAPFPSGDAGEVLGKVQRGEHPRPRELDPHIHPALEAICLKALALRPGDRYPSPKALADDLEHWLADERVAAYREPAWRRLSRWGRRRQGMVGSLAALLAVAIGLGAVSLSRAVDAYLIEREARRRWAEHPDFKPNRDPGKLKFNHQLHMAAGLGLIGDRNVFTLAKIAPEERERYRRPGQGDESPVQLRCASCHSLDSSEFQVSRERLGWLPVNSVLPARTSGQHMLPIVYELHCRACHGLDFVRGGGGAITGHRLQPAEVRALLEGFFAREYLNGVVPRPAGVEGRLPDYVAEKVAGVERRLYDKSTCMQCHYGETGGDSFVPRRIEPTIIPEVWYPNAFFSHAAHAAVDCTDCHAATDSAAADDVLIPDVNNCRRCHNPPGRGEAAGTARYTCSECHSRDMLTRLKEHRAR